MQAATHNGFWLAVAMMAMAAGRAYAQMTAQETPPAPLTPGAAQRREIVVSLEDRRLALIENGQITRIYTVAVGKPSTPSPQGAFTIQRRIVNPVYRHEGKTVLPGPGNPVGTRWMGLNKSGYGIHGTNEPRSIGKAASHGCIRMAKKDLEEFYELVAVGDTVRLIGQRDEETARLFGPAQQANPPTALLLAHTEAAPALDETAVQVPAQMQIQILTQAPAVEAAGGSATAMR